MSARRASMQQAQAPPGPRPTRAARAARTLICRHMWRCTDCFRRDLRRAGKRPAGLMNTCRISTLRKSTSRRTCPQRRPPSAAARRRQAVQQAPPPRAQEKSEVKIDNTRQARSDAAAAAASNMHGRASSLPGDPTSPFFIFSGCAWGTYAPWPEGPVPWGSTRSFARAPPRHSAFSRPRHVASERVLVHAVLLICNSHMLKESLHREYQAT